MLPMQYMERIEHRIFNHFPHQIAMAATESDLVEEMAKITAYELRASNSPWNFAPVIDVSWQAQWVETTKPLVKTPI